ncbi:HU family DNA-binding protein [uncultured Bacteroides sp.]|uniref:HU family DNA-binding protein n=1 Tax=uncultured Bacteroides sp. TaxID=162156 RepID=UPI00261F1290|nr:HU family DNA-binding protein [uncultured Bacteroides sp.]
MNEKVNIQNLIELLVEKHRIAPKEAEEFVKTFFAVIEKGLEQDKYVKIKGLGTFKLIGVESRGSIDVNTGERIEIQGHTKVSFTPDSALKELINRPFGHFETVILNENTVLEDTPIERTDENELEDTSIGQNAANESAAISDIFPEAASPSFESVIVTENVAIEESADEQEKEGESSTTEETQKNSQKTEDTDKGVLPQAVIKENKGNGLKWFAIVLICVLGACASIVFYLYYPDLQEKSAPISLEEEYTSPTVMVDLKQDSIQEDSLKRTEDTLRIQQSTNPASKQQVEIPQKVVKETTVKAQPVEPDSVNYEIMGTETTYTVKEGETLTRISLRFYGTKALWPYIVKHNADVLKNPNNVTSGTTLKIPKLIEKQ